MIISSNNRRLLLCVRPTLGSLTRLFSKFVDDAMVTYLPVPCHWISAESILASEKFSQQIQTIKFWLENSVSLMTNFLLHFSYQIHRLVLKVLLSIHFVLFHISFLILFFYFFFFQISLVYLFVLYVPFSLLRSLKMQVFFFCLSFHDNTSSRTSKNIFPWCWEIPVKFLSVPWLFYLILFLFWFYLIFKI